MKKASELCYYFTAQIEKSAEANRKVELDKLFITCMS